MRKKASIQAKVTAPVHAVAEIKDQFRNNSLPVRIPNTRCYNCWGFVAFYFKWIKSALWIADYEMEDMLTTHTKAVTQPRRGDIVVFRREGGELTHTAVMVDKDQRLVCHKPGHHSLCVESVHNVETLYLYGKATFRRLLPTAPRFA